TEAHCDPPLQWASAYLTHCYLCHPCPPLEQFKSPRDTHREPPTFFFYCNTCNVLPGPAVGWGWCVGVVLQRGVACGGIETGGGGGRGQHSEHGQGSRHSSHGNHPSPA